MILVNAHGLTKSFAGRTLFTDLSFGIHQGEKVGLVGPNGAGKSTLLKLLTGAVESDSGKIVYRTGMRIGYLEQDPQFEKDATLFDTILGPNTDGDSYERAMQISSKMGLGQFDDLFPVHSLSGGWQKRLALARELMKQPELLFLDEPTNHLDVEGVLWLEDFVQSSRITFLTVTHDRLFLQRVATRILDLDPRNPKGLVSIEGGYLAYLEYKMAHTETMQRQEQKMKNTLRRETEWLRRGSIARQTKQQARQSQAAVLKDDVENITSLNRRRKVGVEFEESQKSPKKLVELEEVSKSFGEKVLFQNLNFILGHRTRVALLGPNGSGKSTLIRILIGQEPPSSGTVKSFDGLQISYFEQGKESLDLNKTIRQNLSGDGDYVHFNGGPVHVGSYLDRFMFGGQKAHLPAHRLSGGEKARLRLAQLMLTPAQVLVLDEPTNDLDTETLEVLEDALKDFPGAVVLVTHDRYFLDSVSDTILALPGPDSEDFEIVKFADYFQWEAYHDERKTSGASQNQKVSAKAATKGKDKLSFKEKNEFEKMEKLILELEQKLKDQLLLLEDPAVTRDGSRLKEINQFISKLEKEIAEKYSRWSDLESRGGAR